MVIDRSKHNKYSVNLVYTPSSTALTEQQTALSGSSLTIYISGGSGSGSGLTEEQLKKLESIEEGALVNQNAFSTVLVSDGSITNEITAQNPSDTIKLTYVNPIEISLVDGNILISYVGNDSLWSLDESGNLWTDRNVYSTKEISAYGFREGGVSPGGASYLYELGDVDYESAFSPINKGILQYNSTLKKWVVTDGSNIKPDLSGYATQTYVNQQIAAIVGSAPEVLDTIYEIAEALNNDPDYVKDIADNLSNLTNRVVKLEDMFEWDNGVIKAKADLYGVGEISAYGYNSGSTPSGAQNLSELLDVDLTNLADQCILQYNILTKKWEATDGSNIKPDLSEYATRSWVISQLDTTSSNLRNEFDTSISDVNSLLVVINGNITTIQGNITSLQNSVSSINEEILSIKANITTIKGDITNIKAALELLNNMFEWDGTRIKAKADLYGVGEISAYGYQDGSAGSGAQYLYELLDVTLTELTSGLLLQWDGSKWININKDEVGLNESELLQYLTENNYAKKSDIPKVIDWTNITSKPSWITDEKPTYSWTDITNKPTVFTTNIGNISDLNSSWNSLLKNKPTAYITRWPSFSEVTNKPTTLSGYGITDGVNSITLTGSGNAVTSASINGHVITLTKGSTFSLSTHNHDSVYVNVTGDTMTGTLTLPTIVVNTRIQLGNAYIEYDSTNNAVVIKNKTTNQIVNFYATGEVSAYGYGDGTNPSGVTYLSELEDVKLTSIAENDMLVWNGSVWVNTPMADITPELNVDNITDLNTSWRTLLKSAPSAYVTRWPTISEVTNKQNLIIKLNSGTTEGTNLFTYNVTTAKTVNITPSAIGAAASSHNHSWSNITSGKPTTLAGYGITDAYTKTDSDSRYVNITGDTMTGALITKITDGSGVRIAGEDGYGYLQLGNMNSTSTAQKGIICGYRVSQLASLDIRTSNLSGGVTINRNKIWHAGNDGAGSGLDADKLYGLSYNSYESYRKTTIDASDLNNNTWYPVVMVLPAAKRVRIRVEDVTNADASWNNRADKKMGLVLDYTAVGSAWGWVSENRIIYWYNEGSGASSCLRGLGQLTSNSAEYIFVRGGAKYNFYLSHFIVPKLYTTIYTGSGGQTIAPTTSMPAAITRNSALITDNVASANKLYNPRTIWGQSFNGTTNISGELSSVSGIRFTGTGSFRFIANGNLVSTNDDDTYSWLITKSTGATLFGIKANSGNANFVGNLGIGIASPSYKLHVNGSVGVVGAFNGYGGRFRFGSDDTTDDTYSKYHRLDLGYHGINHCDFYEKEFNFYINGGSTQWAKIAETSYFTGNVGIGTTSPSYKLHVFGTFGVSGAVTLSSTLSVTGTSTFTGAITVNGESTFSKLLHVNGGAHTLNNKYFSTFNTSGTYCSMLGIDGNNYGFAGTTEKIAGMVLKSYDLFLFTFNGSANYVTIDKSGIVCKGEITAFSSSDIRLKKNLKELKAINTLRKINTFEYDWTEEALLLKANKNVHDYGIIAQELESIIPEAVTHDMYGKGYLGIDYTKLIPFTISAIKEVDDEVTTLKKRVKELEDRLSKYESSVK